MQNSRKNKHANDNTPVFESPDGILIRINRGGNKMQFVRDLCRNEKITHVQFRMLVPLVDASNEGAHENPSLWGKSWMNVETLAKESGCSVRAVKDNMPLLEAAGIVKVKRDLTDDGRPKGGRSNVNEYWLPGWNRFGAVDEDQTKGAHGGPFSKEQTVHPAAENGARGSKNGARGSENRAHHAPDSTYSPHSETPPKDPTQAVPASGKRGPAAGSVDDDRPQSKPANDHVEIEPWPEDIEAMVDKFQSYYPKGGDRSKIADALEEIRREGNTEFRDILRGASNYKRESAGTDPQWITFPENFLRKRGWKGYQQDHRQRPKPSMAI
ncbi:hypothetical protein [Bradyrhizobium sp. 131]|uniref:hypothetical protein n=1 Tax=Bradyrhizobium sp. 131 TaxID=2782609 RepID=UPI001FFED9FE|nr:hypothetical protein [Bradyrhizobium sp. 131]UPK17595.1 hypothetical protein IVA73_26400 [Bradyrhizobium sp. 131]